jgi:hypothetical protein
MTKTSNLELENGLTPLFYPTTLKTKILKALAEFECLTVRDLTFQIFFEVTESRMYSVWRCLKHLGPLVTSIQYSDAPTEFGTKPDAWGLSRLGVRYALIHFPETDPVELSPEHSKLTVGHEIFRARSHYVIREYCTSQGWQLQWTKSNLFKGRKPVPDDNFSIKHLTLPEGQNKLYFVFEKERKKKDFAQLMEKIEGYERLYNTDEAEHRFGSRKFRVIFQIENDTRRINFVEHLAGICRCTTWKSKIRHTCLSVPVKKNKYWFTTDELMLTNPGGNIFITPKDYKDAAHSFESAFTP